MDNLILVNDIGWFFDCKIVKIWVEFDVCIFYFGVVVEDKVFIGDRKFDYFNMYFVEDIRKLVSRLLKKSC